MSLAIGMGIGMPFERRSVGAAFSPSDISNMIAWYDAALGITLNGADVSQWADQSGNGNDLAQANASKQPQHNSSDSDFNNLPSVEFDGGAESISRTAFTGGNLTQPVTIVLVFKEETHATNTIVFDGSNSTQKLSFTAISSDRWIMRGPNNGPIPDSDLNTNVLMCQYNGASSGFWANGNFKSGGNIGSNVLSGIVLGALYSQASAHWNGKFAEFIIYNATLSDADKNSLGNYLADKYALTWTDI